MLTCCSSGVPVFSLKDNIRAGKILDNWRDKASPATDDNCDKAQVLTGGVVSCNKQIKYQS